MGHSISPALSYWERGFSEEYEDRSSVWRESRVQRGQMRIPIFLNSPNNRGIMMPPKRETAGSRALFRLKVWVANLGGWPAVADLFKPFELQTPHSEHSSVLAGCLAFPHIFFTFCSYHLLSYLHQKRLFFGRSFVCISPCLAIGTLSTRYVFITSLTTM